MTALDTTLIVLAGIALFASFVNGALGYGFSSLTVPLALVFYTNRVLNPAVVLVEVFINLYVLLINLKGVPSVWRRVLPILVGLLPGIGLGALGLASLHPGWIKLVTYVVILPLILLQASGQRWPIRSSWLVGLPFGGCAGRPLFGDDHLRPAARHPVQQPGAGEERVSRRACAGARGRIERDSAGLLEPRPVHHRQLEPVVGAGSAVIVGIPLGAFVIRRMDAETFRRICMSFDAWVVGFGLSRV